MKQADLQKILDLAMANFEFDSRINVDNEGLIHTTGDARRGTLLRKPFPGGTLPVRFHVARDFNIEWSAVASLEGCPVMVLGTFDASYNPALQSLLNGPKIVNELYTVSNCGLRSLQGAPASCKFLNIQNNQLTSLKGIEHTRVQGYVNALNNPLASLDHLPQGNCDIFVWHESLPVLKLVIKDNPRIHFIRDSAREPFRDIIERYRGKGRDAVIPCAAELHKAGFGGNAKL